MPVIGTAYSINPARLVESATKLGRKYGEIYLQQIPGKPPLYIISSHRLVDELFDETRFKKVIHPAIAHVEPFAGNGLFTAETDDPEWEKGHRILMPAFSPMALKGMYEGMADVAEQLLLKWTRTRDDEVIDVTEDFTRLTLDTIALCSFSYRFNSFYSEGMHPFVSAMVGGLYESGRRAHAIDIQKKMMVYSQHKFDQYISTMHDTVDKLIEQRKRHPHSKSEWDILDIMLTAQDPVTGEKLSDKNVRFQLVNFLIAGHETTSGMLGFTLHLLMKNPEILNKARAVVDEVLGGRFPEYEDLPKLSYLDQIFRESLRLYPTAPGLAVTPLEPTTIGGPDGYAVNPGDTLFVLIGLMHRDPKIWEDPEKFDPDRFSFENAKEIPVSAWKPFGNGQRSCIGRAFSLQESTIVLALLLQHLDFEFAVDAKAGDSTDLKIKETLTIKPEGFKVYARPRPGFEFHGRGVDMDRAQGIDTGDRGDADAEGHYNPEGPANGQPFRVLVGSNAGTCRSFAQRIAMAARRQGFEATLRDLNEATGKLDTSTPTVVVCSSYEGLPPDNAKEFVSWLVDGGDERDLEGLPFAVFGSGNSQWANSYQRVPTLIDDAIAARGGTRLHARGVADVQTDFEESFAQWQRGLWASVADHFDIEISDDEIEATLEISTVDAGRAAILNPYSTTVFGTGIVMSNTALTENASVAEGITEKREVAVRLPEDVSYNVGDYIEVLPKNSEKQVSRFLARFQVTGEQRVRITTDFPGLPTDEPISVEELVTGYFELGQPATRAAIQKLAETCPCPPEAAELRELLEDERYEREVLGKRISVLDLLERFPSIMIDVESALGLLPVMAPRRYSISSSPLVDPTIARITFTVDAGPAWSGTGEFEGVASRYLTHSAPGKALSVAVLDGPENFGPGRAVTGADRSESAEQQAEHSEDDPQLILIGAGSGIAPLKAFLDHVGAQREEASEISAGDGADSQSAGTHNIRPHLLYFGCHGEHVDFLYREHFAEMQERGVVDVRPAFSRDENSPFSYVQDRLWHDRQEINDALAGGARILVCGDAQRMGQGVRNTVVEILADQRGLSADQAEELMTDMITKQFSYVSDLFD